MDPGTVLANRFVLEQQAASGGMGTVYRAHDRLTGEAVALKVLHAQGELDGERFEREASILAELAHPGIVRYVAHGATAAGAQYLAMEWLDGEDLAARLARGPLPPASCLALLRKAADALGFAHARGVVHRDVKPSNLFLVENDVARLKIVDFGIARPDGDGRRLTLTGGVVGTPGYMAPEQMEASRPPDPRSDVFALGCVLFECVTGRPAFEAAHAMAALAKVLFQDPPRLRELRPEVPEPLEALVARMLAKPPAERPADAAEVIAELDRIQAELAAWAAPLHPVTLTSGAGLEPAGPAARARAALTLSEQRLVSLVLVGAPAPGAVDAEAELRAAVEPYGGKLHALAPGTLAVMLSGPGSAIDRAERAAQCAEGLRVHLPGARICVVTGRGVVSARALEGDVFDRGAALLEATPPGVIRLDEVTAGMLAGRFRMAGEGGEITLVGEAAGEEAAPALLGKPTPWVGRSRELAMLQGVLSGCVAESTASAVLVLGPAGAGKSRLRFEFLSAVRRGGAAVEILSGRAESVAHGSPLGMIADVVRRAAGFRDADPIEARRRKLEKRLGRELAGEDLSRVAAFLGELTGTPFPEGASRALGAARGSALRMSDAVRAAWEDWLVAECAARPVLLVLEDLHWGDAATVRLLDATLRNLRDLPLMVLVLARPDVLKQFPGLWADREVQTIKLGPLPRRACEQIVRAALGEGARADVVARLVERADGNPFYLEELVRAAASDGDDALPDSVLGTVEARLDGEGTEAKRILRAASVFGDRFSKFGVAALLGGEQHLKETEGWLDALSAREIVAPASAPGVAGPTDYVFRHSIVREAAYAMLTETDRALGHKLAAGWLERTGHPDALVLAEHFRRGGEPDRAARWYRRAAEQALEASDLPAALQRAAAGLACGAAGEDLGALRLCEAEANVWKGDLARAEEHGGAAAGLLPRGSPLWFRAVTQIAAAAGKLGGFDRVARWAAAAAAEASPAPGPRGGAAAARIACLAECAMELTFGGRFAEADALIAQIEAALGDLPEPGPEIVAAAQQLRAIRASAAGDPGACLVGLQAALAAFEQAGDRRSACVICSNLGFIYAELGDFEAAESALRFAMAAADRMGLLELRTAILQNLGHVLAHRGQIDEAWLLEQRAAEAFQGQGDLRMEGVARTYLAKIALLSGDDAAAEREARAAVERLAVAPPQRAAALAVLARALLARGDVAGALGAAREAYGELDALGALEEGESLVRLAYAEALTASGAEREAALAIARARQSLLARAARIADPAFRERFLTGVPDNARTLAIASQRGARRGAPRTAAART